VRRHVEKKESLASILALANKKTFLGTLDVKRNIVTKTDQQLIITLDKIRKSAAVIALIGMALFTVFGFYVFFWGQASFIGDVILVFLPVFFLLYSLTYWHT